MGSKRVRHDWVTRTFTEVYEVTLDFLISLSPYFLIMLKEMLNGLDFQSIFIPTINFLTKNMYEAWGSCLLSVHLYAVSYLILNKQYQGNYQSKYQASILSGYSISTPQYPSGTYGEDNGNPLQCSCLENPRDGGAWSAAFYGVAQSRTRLKLLSSSSSSSNPSYKHIVRPE